MEFQKNIISIVSTMIERGMVIKSVNWQNGEIVAHVLNSSEGATTGNNNILSDEEIAACRVSKIEGIKKIRNTRNISLADAKVFAEKHYDFPPNPRGY
jgi:ribosomal protein L7/L12